MHGEVMDGTSQAMMAAGVGLSQIFHTRQSFAERHMKRYSQSSPLRPLSKPIHSHPHGSFSNSGKNNFSGDPRLSRISRRQRHANESKDRYAPMEVSQPNLYKNLKIRGYNPQITKFRPLPPSF